MLRRLVATAALALLMTPSALAVARACDAAPVASHSGHSDHAQHPDVPTDSPTQPEQCCDVMSACVLSLALNAERDIGAVAFTAAVVMPATDDAHGATLRGPEPPPPRATAL